MHPIVSLYPDMQIAQVKRSKLGRNWQLQSQWIKFLCIGRSSFQQTDENTSKERLIKKKRAAIQLDPYFNEPCNFKK